MNISVRKLENKDLPQAINLISAVVKDIFMKNGLVSEKYQLMIKQDLEKQEKRLNDSLKPNSTIHFLIASESDKLLGTIGFAPIGKEIQEALNRIEKNIKHITEIVSLYVDSNAQGKGIGTLLFQELLSELKKEPYKYFAVCSGYKEGIIFWSKKLGKEAIVLKKFYSGHDCKVWIRELHENT